MYRGFSLNIENENFDNFFDNDIVDGLIHKEYVDNISLYKNYQDYLITVDYPTFYDDLDNNYGILYDDINSDSKNIINTKISSFVDDNEEINLTDIGENWFPNIEADVFISHSHKDEKLALWLHYCFGIKAFIDSTVWGYSKNLLHNIINNKKYGYILRQNTYRLYETLNINSHIDMLLSMALTKMIDRCECLIFLNTPNSISRKDTMEITYSPWIYHEIGVSKLIKRTKPNRLQNKDGLVYFSKSAENVIPFLETDTSHLFKLDENILNSWREKSNMRGVEELNYLYRICANRIYRYKNKQKGVYRYGNWR